MNNNRNQIIETISKASTSIQVAVSWLTDEVIIAKLKEAAKNVKVEILLSSDILNTYRYNELVQLQQAGALVSKRGAMFPGMPGFMHAKMMIVDGKYVYGGSFNFTANASSNFENFDTYPEHKVPHWVSTFNNWMADSIDYKVDFENPEKLKRIVQEKFVAEEAFRKQFLSKLEDSERRLLEKEISEREVLIKEEMKKEAIRKQTEAMQKGVDKVQPNGKVSSSGGVASQSHRFYGGKLLWTRFDGKKEKNSYAVALLQKKQIEWLYNFLNCTIVNDTLICTGTIQPDNCQAYKIRLEFRAGTFPQVYITKPEIIVHPDIHMYAHGSLCLFFPDDMKWKNTTSIAEFTVPWVYEWILFYELYLLTGKWEGESVTHLGTCPNYVVEAN